ncbi:MAG: co-chaperone GroES [Planctomycetes bacterium]|jgi:chaperonin GroES|nr:co-chaperone GroES [Planctomycetota bacterium]
MAKTKIAFTPIEDRVLIEPAAAETVSAAGIFLPNSASEAPLRGEVLAVGTGALNKDGSRAELPVKVGDQVVYAKFSGSKIEVGGCEFLIVRANEILAVINSK